MPEEWRKAFGPTNLIEGMEMLSVVAFITQHGARLAVKSVAAYVDNNCALAALVRGSAKIRSVSYHRSNVLVLRPEIRY